MDNLFQSFYKVEETKRPGDPAAPVDAINSQKDYADLPSPGALYGKKNEDDKILSDEMMNSGSTKTRNVTILKKAKLITSSPITTEGDKEAPDDPRDRLDGEEDDKR